MSNSYKVLGDFLQKHAYQHVWCTPNQDKQAILQPARLTPENGTWSSFRVMWNTLRLPNSTSRFHVYQIGQIHPMLLGLAAKQNEWISVADVCAMESLVMDLYTSTGVQIHRSEAWYMVTKDKNLILAVRIPNSKKVPINLNTEPLYIRLYSNAYYNSLRADGVSDVVHVEGRLVASNQDILDIQTSLLNWNNRPYGKTYCFINGFRVNTIDMINSRIGDLIEFVYDGSIKQVVSFAVSSLDQFVSTLDAAHKYLLHHDEVTDTIDYIDDVDVFLIKPGSGDRFVGVYYHKNNETALRMVTHKDYSVPVAYLMSYAQQRPELGSNVDELVLQLHIRKSGYNRPLIQEHNRISQLYEMDDADVYRAMVGVDSTVSVWNAAALEASGYTALMRANLGEISRQGVQDAYGYNALSKLLGDTPSPVKEMGGMYYVDVPVGLQMYSTGYEYDAQGKLLGWYPHTTGAVYVARHSETRMVEMIFGTASEGFQSYWGQMTHPLESGFNYRYYTCGRSGVLIDDQWTDKSNSGEYAITNGVLQWLINPINTYPMVRGNKNHVTYQLDYLGVDGLFTFSLREFRYDIGAYRVMTVPPGKIEVFLNGHSLIEKIDYFVNFPRITIINKEYLDDPQNKAQKIVVRMTGFSTSDLKHEVVRDVGFVKYGVLSLNKRYDIREDRVNRIVVDGALYRYDELEYGEQDFEIRVVDARNGAPYAITDIVVPMNDYLNTLDEQVDPTYSLRHRSQIVDKEISDYLTLKLPEKTTDQPSAIAQRYQVVSPFFCKIIYDLISGALWEPEFIEHYSDDYVRTMCAPYEYLLEFDPIKEGQTPSSDFVVIHAHNLPTYLELGIYQYKFINRVAAVYGQNKIDLSSNVRVAIFGDN